MDYSIKVLIVGSASVGKTSLCHRYTEQKFTPAYKPTVGVEFHSKSYYEPTKDKIFVSLWDIGGQERYIGMTHVFYKNADFCLIVFDLTNRDSFYACAKWKMDLDDKYELSDGSNCPCLLIGNKCDLQTRVLTQTEIDDFCRKYGFYGYMEVSVKKDVMVSETMNYIIEQAIKNKDKVLIKSNETPNKYNRKTDSLCIKLKAKCDKCSCFSFAGKTMTGGCC